MNLKVKRLTAAAMLSAMSFIVMAVIKIPVYDFLKYEPKDVLITIGGFIYGPYMSVIVSLVVSFLEMVTVSSTGPWGLFMNVLSTICFSYTATIIYKKNRSLKGAVIGLFSGWMLMTAAMIIWNYLITPFYMGVPREVVASMLIPVFLPFNLIKGGLNAAIILLIYKPITNAMKKMHIIEENNATQSKKYGGLITSALVLLVTCILFILVVRGIL